jgi:hypothetical protein
MFMPNPRSGFFHPGSRVKKVGVPIDEEFKESCYCYLALGNMIRDAYPGSGIFPSRIKGSKEH